MNDQKPHKLGLQDIQEASERISPYVLKTPLVASPLSQNESWKLEIFQHTGAFKVRGSSNKILSLSEKELENGVITASAGNHGQGVARMAQKLGVPATIVMPEKTPIVKVNACENFGARTHLYGNQYDQTFEKALELAKESGATFVHAFDDEKIIAGQGTIGLEVHEQCPLDVAVIPVGGGGLIAGTAVALKSLNPKIKILGVQAENAPSMSRSFQKGRIVQSFSKASLADGINVKKVYPRMFPLIQEWVDDMVTVTEDEIAHAIFAALEKGKILLEGAGAAGLAASLAGKIPEAFQGHRCIFLCGGNLDPNILNRVVERGLILKGRIHRIQLKLTDQPGALSKLTKLFSEEKVNILQVIHSRASQQLELEEIQVEATIETAGPKHFKRVEKALKEKNWLI
jgi:threonine dehydratase